MVQAQLCKEVLGFFSPPDWATMGYLEHGDCGMKKVQ